MTKPTKDESKMAGGVARAHALTPEQRKGIAEKAAAARWGVKAPVAMHKGNFKEDFGIDVACYVLNDPNKTAVISQMGMGRALGLTVRGNAFPRFISSNRMANYVSAELLEKIEKPIKFQWGGGSAEQPQSEINGYDVTLLIDVCQAVLAADQAGVLLDRQKPMAVQARIILNASAKSGIKGLVYALAGYNPTSAEVIAAFKAYIQEEAKKYEQEFPPEIYIAWHRLYQLPVPVRGKPWQFKHLTLRHIYYPLAKSSGKILELLRAEKAKDGDRQKKLFQFLSEVGTRALRIHLGRVLEIAESSQDRHAYEAKITDRFGGQQELDLVIPTPSTT